MCLNKTQFLSLILKLKSRKTRELFQEFLIWVGFFNWGNWEFPRFPGFRFWSLYWNRKLRKLENFFKTSKFEWISFMWKNWEFSRFESFRFWPLYWNRKLGKLGNFFKSCNCFPERNWKFLRFPSFRFGPYTKTENSWNLKTFSRRLNLREFLLFQEIESFGDFRVFDFSFWQTRNFFQDL